MRTLATALLLATALSVAVAIAQTYNGPPAPTALVCAYNSGGAPTPTNGQFYYAQCNSSGALLVSQ